MDIAGHADKLQKKKHWSNIIKKIEMLTRILKRGKSSGSYLYHIHNIAYLLLIYLVKAGTWAASYSGDRFR